MKAWALVSSPRVLATHTHTHDVSHTGEDAPLVWITEGFSRINGWSRTEALGRNCRFLQTEATVFGRGFKPLDSSACRLCCLILHARLNSERFESRGGQDVVAIAEMRR